MNEIATSPSLSNEEQELHELLDRVLGTTTTRPILDGMAARLESLQDEVLEAIENAKAGMTGQIRSSERGLRSAIEDGLAGLQGRIDAELTPALRELQTETRERVDRLESIGAATVAGIEALTSAQQALAAATARRDDLTLTELRASLTALQETQTRSESAIQQRVARLEELISEQHSETKRMRRWMLALQGLLLITVLSATAALMLGGLR